MELLGKGENQSEHKAWEGGMASKTLPKAIIRKRAAQCGDAFVLSHGLCRVEGTGAVEYQQGS